MPARSDTVALVGISGTVAVVDQVAKSLVAVAIGPGAMESRVEVIYSWLALEYTQNTGAAFGLLSGLVSILTVASIAMLMLVLLFYMRQASPPAWQTVAIGLISGGALGNLIDRVRLGYVVDFVSVGPWPNFNLADSAITVGVLVLIWGVTRPATAIGMARATDPGG